MSCLTGTDAPGAAVTRCSACATENPAEARFCMSAEPRWSAAARRAAWPRRTARASACHAAARWPAAGHDCADGLAPRRGGAERRGGRPQPACGPARTLDERRTATVLFADLSGYTAIAETLDPESVKRLLDRILARLGEEVHKYGGYIDKFIGDNVMAIFGAPIAHGDDAERAVRAGLGMQAAMDEINAPLAAQHGVTFALCVGHQHRRGARRATSATATR